jgi:hypothetical protein
LATVTGCKGRTSEYTLLIHGQGLDEARKRTADEIFQILYPDASEPLTPSPVRGSTPHQCRPHLPIDLSKESTLGQASGEDTSPLSHRRPPIREAKGRRAKVSKGEPSFEFLPSQGRLDDVFWSGNPDDTHCLSDSTIVQGLRRAASGRIGRALQTEAGLDTVRQMAASVTAELECSPQEAFHLIQRRIWDRIGSRPGEWLNCYGLLFVPLCNSLDLQDVEIGHQDQCRAALAALDVDGRIDLELLFGPSTYELSGLLLEFEEAQIIAATAMALAANNSQIHGFSYLREFITEPRSESDATARHHTYART